MKLLILFLLTAAGSIVFSQAIVTDPVFPTENDSISITFNVKEMSNTELLGYNGTVYIHTGVYTNLDGSTWQHVIGSWGNNPTQPSLTRIDTDLYSITISNPRDFYNITSSSEHITFLNFVLRSSDASKKSEDLFLEIFEQGLNVKILEPKNLPIYPLSGENIDIVAVTNGADSLSLLLNDELITTTQLDTLKATITANGTGRQWLKFIAVGNENILTDSIHFFIRDNLAVEDPPSGIEPGINYIDDNTVTLALFAPNKEFIYLIGDFNNWDFDPDSSTTWEFDDNYYLKISSDSTTYWTTITGLVPNQEYRFQYLVEGNLRIADPYSDKILEEEDSFISDATYPNLISYPATKTKYSVSVLETGQDPYVWEADEYQKPDKSNLIVYELLIRDFVSTHDYSTLIDTLDYLENLGITAIELMPVNEFEGNESWGYNPSFYFAPDKYYGTKNDLKKFIDECHKRNIAVILDIVLNHSYGRSPFVRLYSSGDFGPPTSENPWYNVNSPNPVFSWGFDFNHESEHTKQLIDRINQYWLEEYKFDGYRFDFTKGFTNTSGDGSGFDQARINILKRMADKIWEYDSTAYLILEHFAPDSEEKILTDYGMMVWGNNNYNYNEATMGYHDNSKSNFKRISYKEHGFTKPHLVGYMESHDEERLMYKNIEFGNSFENYNIKNLGTALSRIKLVAAFFITVPGPKMIWQFGELGYDYSIDFNGRVGNKPIKWDYLDDINRNNLYKTYSALTFLKNNYPTFNTDSFALNLNSSTKTIHLNHDSMDVIIFGNFDVKEITVVPGFQSTGTWYNYFSGESITINSTDIPFSLNPGEFHIYTTNKLPTPEQGILVSLGNEEITLPTNFKLNQNYPNPFNPTTSIEYSIPNTVTENKSSVLVTLTVYDILGRKVKTLVNENQKVGNYSINFDGSRLASGVYYYTLSAAHFLETKKMILLK